VDIKHRHHPRANPLLTTLSLRFDPQQAKIRLTMFSFSIFLAGSNNPTLHFWRIYAMDFPERPNMKAPRGFRNSLWSLFIFKSSLQQFHLNNKGGFLPTKGDQK
jgi:hypothetical protein